MLIMTASLALLNFADTNVVDPNVLQGSRLIGRGRLQRAACDLHRASVQQERAACAAAPTDGCAGVILATVPLLFLFYALLIYCVRSNALQARRHSATCNALRATCNMRCAPSPKECARNVPCPCHICTETGLAPATSAPGVGPPLPHLHRDWAHPCHICTGT